MERICAEAEVIALVGIIKKMFFPAAHIPGRVIKQDAPVLKTLHPFKLAGGQGSDFVAQLVQRLLAYDKQIAVL